MWTAVLDRVDRVVVAAPKHKVVVLRRTRGGSLLVDSRQTAARETTSCVRAMTLQRRAKRHDKPQHGINRLLGGMHDLGRVASRQQRLRNSEWQTCHHRTNNTSHQAPSQWKQHQSTYLHTKPGSCPCNHFSRRSKWHPQRQHLAKRIAPSTPGRPRHSPTAFGTSHRKNATGGQLCEPHNRTAECAEPRYRACFSPDKRDSTGLHPLACLHRRTLVCLRPGRTISEAPQVRHQPFEFNRKAAR